MSLQYEDLIGRPFEYGARPPSKSLDCYGLVVEVSQRLGKALPVRQFSEQGNVIGALMSMQMDEWEQSPREIGAVLLFRVMGIAQHVGIIVSPFEFIHTWEGTGGVVVERIDNWEQRIVGSYRYKC
jgi:cell wall-associated NlpC family hydrolase